MKIILVSSVILLITLIATKYAIAYRVVCYYTNFAQYRPGMAKFTPDNIDSQLCDVIVYAFGKLSNNSLTTGEWNDDDMISSVVAKKKDNPNLKVLICVGGWYAGSKVFSDMVSSSASRQQFIQSAIQFMSTRNLDGLDIAWEYPADRDGSKPQDKQLLTTFLQEARAAFKQYNLLLTISVASNPLIINAGYEPNKIAEYLDWIHLMAYDFHGSWETSTGFNAPLYARNDETGDLRAFNVDASVLFWSDNGFPIDKIILGMPFYGHSFTLANPNNYMLGAPANGAGTAGQYTVESGIKSYFEICDDLKNGFISEWNADQMVPFIYKGNQWISYDNIKSIQAKANYVKSQGLGGAMIMALDFDDFTGSFCSQGNYPLLNTVKQILSTVTDSPTSETFASTSSLIADSTQVATTETTEITSVTFDSTSSLIENSTQLTTTETTETTSVTFDSTSSLIENSTQLTTTETTETTSVTFDSTSSLTANSTQVATTETTEITSVTFDSTSSLIENSTQLTTTETTEITSVTFDSTSSLTANSTQVATTETTEITSVTFDSTSSLIENSTQLTTTETTEITSVTFVSTSSLTANSTQVATTETTAITSVNNSLTFVIDHSSACRNYYLCFEWQIFFVICIKYLLQWFYSY